MNLSISPKCPSSSDPHCLCFLRVVVSDPRDYSPHRKQVNAKGTVILSLGQGLANVFVKEHSKYFRPRGSRDEIKAIM